MKGPTGGPDFLSKLSYEKEVPLARRKKDKGKKYHIGSTYSGVDIVCLGTRNTTLGADTLG